LRILNNQSVTSAAKLRSRWGSVHMLIVYPRAATWLNVFVRPMT
jgi:hypothetical protein